MVAPVVEVGLPRQVEQVELVALVGLELLVNRVVEVQVGARLRVHYISGLRPQEAFTKILFHLQHRTTAAAAAVVLEHKLTIRVQL
jgi:hypothetical protein